MADYVETSLGNATLDTDDVPSKTADRALLRSNVDNDSKNDRISWNSEWDTASGSLDLSMPKLSITVTSPEVVSSMMSRYAVGLTLIF